MTNSMTTFDESSISNMTGLPEMPSLVRIDKNAIHLRLVNCVKTFEEDKLGQIVMGRIFIAFTYHNCLLLIDELSCPI